MKKDNLPPTVYVGTSDVDAVTERVKENGGTVVVEPMDVYDKGRMAVFKDPDGGEFAAWQSKTHFGIPQTEDSDILDVQGFPGWFELNTRNLDRALDFYTKVFGWDYYSKVMLNMNYTIFFAGDKFIAGCIQMTDEFPKDLPSHWMTYFQVNNIDASVKLVKELGGTVCFPPVEIEGMKEKMCMINDPCGVSMQLMGEVPRKEREMRLDNLKTRTELSQANLKIAKLERRIKKLQDLLKSKNIEFEDEGEEKKVVEEKPTLKRKLSSTTESKNGNKPNEQPETKKRKKN